MDYLFLIPIPFFTSTQALSPREREILTADLGPSRMAMFVGGIPEVEDVGVFRPVKIPAKFSAYDVNPKVSGMPGKEFLLINS